MAYSLQSWQWAVVLVEVGNCAWPVHYDIGNIINSKHHPNFHSFLFLLLVNA